MIDFVRTPRREPMVLQLTALIDVFSMIVIFLVLGSVINSSDVVIPGNLKIPESMSKESLDAAPKLIFDAGQIHFPAANLDGPLDSFRARNESAQTMKEALKKYVDTMPPAARSAGTLLNVVADKNTPYEDIFDVIKTFREAGFDTILFVTIGKGGGT